MSTYLLQIITYDTHYIAIDKLVCFQSKSSRQRKLKSGNSCQTCFKKSRFYKIFPCCLFLTAISEFPKEMLFQSDSGGATTYRGPSYSHSV